MEPKKLEINQLFEGLWSFTKQQCKRLDTWAMIGFLSYVGAVGLYLFASLLVGLDVLYFFFQAPAIFDFQNRPWIFIVSILVTLLLLFVAYKIMKKAVGIANVIMLNALAAVENKALPRFTERDERLSFLFFMFLYFLIIALGAVLLIIPGIIFLVRFYFGYPIMLDEKCSPVQALQKSWELTRGNFWQIFVFIGPLFLISSAIPLFTIIFMFIPLNLWMQAYIYQQLKEQKIA